MNIETCLALLPGSAATALFAWNIVLFAVALRRSFIRPDGLPGAMRALAICGAAVALGDGFLLCTVPSSPWRNVMGIVLLLGSQLLFRSAIQATRQTRLSLAFSGDLPGALNQSGPYRFIRHPFYAAYSMTWLAAAVVTAHAAAFAALPVMLAFYISAARQEERKFLNSPLSRIYRQYQTSAGMFLPFFRPNRKQTNPTA